MVATTGIPAGRPCVETAGEGDAVESLAYTRRADDLPGLRSRAPRELGGAFVAEPPAATDIEALWQRDVR